MKKFLLRIVAIFAGIYVLICLLMFFFQEKLIFHPEKLDAGYKFNYEGRFEELKIASGNAVLHGLLFKANPPRKGFIFYLHGNSGSLSTWGSLADPYISLGYDVFLLDYRGYGKSSGQIEGESQFYEDIQIAYDHLKRRYHEDSTIIVGFSIGSGPAAKLASVNKPRLLILEAPYYNLTDMMRQRYPFAPTFILKYKFNTAEYIQACKMPVVIFHGDQDEVIYHGSSLKLKEHFKRGDTLITLAGQAHNGISDNPEYIGIIRQILKE